MTEFPMNTRLFRDGLQLERFYANDVGEFSDQLFTMLSFAGDPINDDLKYAHCKEQLLKSFEGRLLMLFGSLNNIRESVTLELWEELSMGICKLFYLQKVADFTAYAKTIHELDEALGTAVLRKKSANDQ